MTWIDYKSGTHAGQWRMRGIRPGRAQFPGILPVAVLTSLVCNPMNPEGFS